MGVVCFDVLLAQDVSRSIYTGALAVFASANSITVRNLSLAFDLGAVNTSLPYHAYEIVYQASCVRVFVPQPFP